MKILYITASNLSEPFGPQVHFTELAGALAEQGVEIICVAPALGRFPEALPCKVIYIPVVPIRKIARISFHLALLFVLPWLIFGKKIDLVYTRCSWYTIVPPLAARLARRPHVAEVNGIFEDDLVRNNRSGFVRWLVRKVESVTYRLSERIIVLTEGMGDRLSASFWIPRGRFSVVPVGALPGRFEQISVIEARKRLELPEVGCIAGFIGSFDKWQEIGFMLEAFTETSGMRSDIRLLLGGDGLLLEEMKRTVDERGASKQVFFPGRIPREKVPLYLAACDILLLPRRKVPYGYSPVKLYEYLAAGRPVVATRVDGFELIEEGEAGLLVEPDDKRAFAGAVVRLADDPEEGARMGRNGRKLVEETYNWKVTAKKTLEVFRSIIDSKGKEV